MRLLKVGRDASCDIVLHSDKVSSLHAEITILNNGDILLEDKGSRNGTFLMNKPIKPGTAVTVRRGDMIRFADVELQWSQIPMPENNSNFKALYGIGSNFRNEIQISGNTVSRFHATLKIGKDGKAYLQDHSKNGTTVNGIKIVKGQNVRIKRSDAIVCGGVPVDLKQFMPPVVWKKIVIGLAAAAVLVGVIFGVKYVIEYEGIKPKDYIPAVVYVQGTFAYQVKIVNDPFVPIFRKLNIKYPEEYFIGKDAKGNFGIIEEGNPYYPITYSGTAFFISTDGKMMTNRHVACPWESLTEEEETEIQTVMRREKDSELPVDALQTVSQIEAFFNDLQRRAARSALSAMQKRVLFLSQNGFSLEELSTLIAQYKDSKIEITGLQTSLGVGYANKMYDSTDQLDPCVMILESGDDNIDLAILQLNSTKTPADVTKIIDVSKAIVDPNEINPLEETYYYIGYPSELGGVNLDNQDGGLKAHLNDVKISGVPGKYQVKLQGEVFGGASGSPILDKRGHLLGVINRSYRFTTTSEGVLAKHAKDLVDKLENK